MRFESVARKIQGEAYHQVERGRRDGRGREVYFRDPVWERLKRRCDERGISVSRYLQTLAELSLDDNL